MTPTFRPLAMGLSLAAILAPTPRATALELSLEQAVSRALENSHDLAASKARVDAAEARIDESSALFNSNPFFSISVFDTTDTRFINDSEQDIEPSLNFSLSQTFEVAGQRGKRIDLARNNHAVAAAGAASSQLSVEYATREAFYATIEARERARFAYELLHWQRQLDTAYANSKRTVQNDSRMRIARAESTYADEQSNLYEQQTELRRLTALPAEENLTLVGELPEEIVALPDLETLLVFARSHRSDLAAHRSALASSDAYVSLVRRSIVPSLTLSGFLTHSEEPGQDEFQYGGSVSFPVPSFQTGLPEVRAAVAERDRAAAEVEDALSLAERQVRLARFTCANAARAMVRVRDEIVPRAEENLALQNAAFDAGKAGLWDLVTTEMDLIYARRELLSAQRSYAMSLLELERAIGGKLKDVAPSEAAPGPTPAPAESKDETK